jgi:hypothetical protein
MTDNHNDASALFPPSSPVTWYCVTYEYANPINFLPETDTVHVQLCPCSHSVSSREPDAVGTWTVYPIINASRFGYAAIRVHSATHAVQISRGSIPVTEHNCRWCNVQSVFEVPDID